MTLRQKASLIALFVSPVLLAGCVSKIRAKAAFQDGNKAYTEEKYSEAIKFYERAVAYDPDMAEAHFYLANSHQALYRPSKADDPENRAHLETAIEEYKKSLEVNKANNEGMKKVRQNTLAALVKIYSDEPYKNYDKALEYAQTLVQDSPEDLKSLFALAALYEKFDKVAEAQQMYEKAFASALSAYLAKIDVSEQNLASNTKTCKDLDPTQQASCNELNEHAVTACSGLAGFYNKALWGGKSKFNDAIETLKKCAALSPDDATGYYKIGTFYWDKGYRDQDLSTAEKDNCAEEGLKATDKALQINPDYCDALTYKNLLLRLKAQVSQNARLRAQLLDQADAVRKLAIECKQQQSEAGAAK